VCCDGRRTGVDAGLDLSELARLLISFGAREAINLDGGGSATLVHHGHLLNRPYSDVDQPAPESRPVVTALLFQPAGSRRGLERRRARTASGGVVGRVGGRPSIGA
jgi:hypothetical protein